MLYSFISCSSSDLSPLHLLTVTSHEAFERASCHFEQCKVVKLSCRALYTVTGGGGEGGVFYSFISCSSSDLSPLHLLTVTSHQASERASCHFEQCKVVKLSCRAL